MKSKKLFSKLISIVMLIASVETANAQWSLTGNAGTSSSNFVGTTDAKPLYFRTSNTIRLTVSSTGNFGFGTTAPTSKLDVIGDISATGGTSTNWNTAYSWGNHALAGYLNAASLTSGYMPYYNGTSLVNTYIYKTGLGSGGLSFGGKTLRSRLINGFGLEYARICINKDSANVTAALWGSDGDINIYDDQGSLTFSDADATNAPMINLFPYNGVSTSYATRMILAKSEAPGDINVGLQYAANDKFHFTRDLFTFGSHFQRYMMTLDLNTSCIGIGDTAPVNLLHVIGYNGNSSSTARFETGISGANSTFNAVEANAFNNFGYGTGVNATGGSTGVYGLALGGELNCYGISGYAVADSGISYGLYGKAGNNNSVGAKYGVYAEAIGSTNGIYSYGVYGKAGTGNKCYAGYFNGVAYASSLRIGNEKNAVGYKLSVDGKVICEELKVQNSNNWPDYVFKKNYHLQSLDEIENQITKDGHLAGMPSAKDAEANGISVGEMQKKLLEKVEELTLYVIDQNKKIVALQKDNEKLKKLNGLK